MQIRMRYGAGNLDLEVPDRNVAGVYRPAPGGEKESKSPLGDLARSPEAESLRAASRGKKVLFLIADATRDEDHGAILEAGFRCLSAPREVVVAITTGSHKAETAGNFAIAKMAVETAERTRCALSRVVIHDCRKATFTDHGTTSRGNRVLLSNILDPAELVLVASDMKHHYFAGYSNPLKDFLPGIAAFETIERNHELALEDEATFGRHPLHADPRRRTNPVAEDMLEAYELAAHKRVCHALVTVTLEGRIAHAHLGPLKQAARNGMEVVDRVASFSVEQTKRLVVSAGGAPQDETLYLSQRAVELTRAAAADGAEVLLLAECAGGIADSDSAYKNFYLELTRPLSEVLESIRGGYKLYQHKAYKFAELLQRIHKLHLASRLAECDVRAAHLEPAENPQGLVSEWIRQDPSCRITFFDEANRLCVLPQ